jgi:hypothetical protein
MRLRPLLSVLLLAALAPAPARAQDPVSPYVLTDSSRFLPRWLEAQAAIGLGWMATPRDERARYGPGVGALAALESRGRRGLAVRLALAYQDLPPRAPDALVALGVPLEYEDFVGHGHSFALTLEAAWRLRRDWWLSAGGGPAYYGANSAAAFLAPGADAFTPYAGSAWAASWTSALRYEFQPTARDHLFAEVRARGTDSPAFAFWSLAVGYRVP